MENKFVAYLKRRNQLKEIEWISFKNKQVKVVSTLLDEKKIYNFDEVELLESTEARDIDGDKVYVGDILDVCVESFDYKKKFKAVVCEGNLIRSLDKEIEMNLIDNQRVNDVSYQIVGNKYVR